MEIDINNSENSSLKYGIIYTDPSWAQTKGNISACRPNQKKGLDYPTLNIQEIKDIHKDAFNLLDDKSNVFMWTIDKFLPETEQFMKELGFTLHARIIWDKGNGVVPAFTVRFSHEYLLWFYKKGHMLMPVPETRGKYATVIREPSTFHSHKPEAVYRMLDDMFPTTRKLELFARNQKKGWDCWGDQTDMFKEIE